MSLNKVILIGNVGKDPDVRYFDSGAAVANFPVATSERGYTLSNGTVVPERTEWHNVVARREQVQFVEKWVKKGSLVYVEGKIRTRTYDDQAGVKRYLTEIHADRVEFFNIGSGTRRDDGQTPGQAQSQAPAAQGGAQPATYQQPAQTYQQPQAGPASDPMAGGNSADDLPF